jgi:glycosyltransferase involved in cell wall biosynthesis
MMEAEISVVTPSYNEVDKIGEYFESLLKQDVLPYEIIIVDGGSTDGTIDIIKHFQKKNSRVRLIKGSHQGPARDRNIGWKAAKGTHILFLDSDCQAEKNLIGSIKKIIEGKKSEERIALHHSVISSWSELVHKYMWYGRTMPRYWMKNKTDFATLVRMLTSIGVIVFPFLWFVRFFLYLFGLCVALILLIGLKNAVVAARKSGSSRYFFTTYLYIFLSFISTGAGIISIPILKLMKKYTVGR